MCPPSERGDVRSKDAGLPAHGNDGPTAARIAEGGWCQLHRGSEGLSKIVRRTQLRGFRFIVDDEAEVRQLVEGVLAAF